MKMTYEETMDSVREALSLGYSITSVIDNLENDEFTNSEALEEIIFLHRHGI
jgi:hypothetical protein